jgi:hypothetical protein
MQLRVSVRKQHCPFKGITTRAEVKNDSKQYISQGQMAECEYAYKAGTLVNELRY